MKTNIILYVLILVFYAPSAYAYIDPGSGSALISIIIGAFVGLGLAIKTFWYKITGIFRRKSDSDIAENPDD